MSEDVRSIEPGALATWVRAIRPFSFTASLMPVAVGATGAMSADSPVRWELGPLVVLASLLLHAATNLVSDAGDYRRGVDRPDTHGGSGVLVEGLLTMRQVFLAGLGMFAAAALLGLVMIWVRGPGVLWLGLAGLAGGFFYGGTRYGYKYYALGDILVFILMGPLMVVGSYFVLTGAFEMRVLLAAIPVGCLVTAILHANNLRDIRDDSKAKVWTVANLLGLRAAKGEYFLLVIGAYLVVAGLVVAGTVTPWCLLVLVSLPLALKMLVLIARARTDNIERIATADVQTAQLHLAFCVLLSVGLALSAVL